MSRIDWDTMLSGLESQRTGLEQELADVDAVIHAVRQRSAPKVSVAEITRPRGNGTKAKPAAKASSNGKGRSRVGLTDDQRATLRAQWESGTGAKIIAARLKITTALLYYYVKTNGWKRPGTAKASRPNPGVAAPPAAAAPTPKGDKLSGEVRCTNEEECGRMTAFDPCSYCGVKLKRKW